MGEEKIIDQSPLAQDVSNKIKYEFVDMFLVKPLDPIKVSKTFSKPVSEETPKKDKNGVEAVDFDKVETEVKEVDSDFRKGVVLKVPYSYESALKDERGCFMDIKIGDVIVFRELNAKYFDLVKDTRLVKYYEVIAVERDND